MSARRRNPLVQINVLSYESSQPPVQLLLFRRPDNVRFSPFFEKVIPGIQKNRPAFWDTHIGHEENYI
jgi:hypothetical protein